MFFETIKYDLIDKTAVITLNRPERMNAVCEEMYDELQAVFNSIEADKNVNCVIIKGSPYMKNEILKYSFCAGADLKKHKEGKRTHSDKRKYIEKAHLVNKKIFEFQKPVIACLNGHARGAGVELALCCDFIIIGEEATIAFPETGLGTFVGGGVTWILPRIVGLMEAKNLIFTGKVLNGVEAVEKGLALFSCKIDNVYDKTLEFAMNFGNRAPVSVGYGKKLLNKSWQFDYETSSNLEADAILSCMDTKDWQEGIDAFNEKRKPVYKGE
ncbi:MAG: enoyl-CoA hydratase-related protein [Desulforegulaceae bacterium]|nr:enoyl-CoA hydratase-related protein [Desulforegulaceae bacterium]